MFCVPQVWKFQDISAIQILREIDFGHFEAQFSQKSKFKAYKIGQMVVYSFQKLAKINFT